MDDDEGHESFDINNADFEYAMNPGRRARFQTKDDAIYGSFGGERDSDDDTRAGPSSRKKQKYSGPVSFVSGGVQQGSKTEKKETTETAKDDVITTDFTKTRKKERPSFGGQVFAGMRASATKGTVDPNKFGDWMKNGKGNVIMNMMSKMGYKEGEGLGAAGQGIVEPVQAALRKGRGAVGAYGKEMTGPKFGETAADAQKRLAQGGRMVDDEEKEQENRAAFKKGWKKSQKVVTKYKTMDDLINNDDDDEPRNTVRSSAHHAQTKVIDMTGPQQKVYTGYDSFSMKKNEEEVDIGERAVFDVPELLQNLNLLIDLTEDSIRKCNKTQVTVKDQTTALEYDLIQLKKSLDEEEKEFNRVQSVFNIIESFTANKNPTMLECQELFKTLKRDYRHEYRVNNLEAVAIPIVLPLIIRFFSQWRPLDQENMSYGLDMMYDWKDVLCDNKKSTFGMNKNEFDEIPAYDRLVWEGWIPHLRRAVLNWNPKIYVDEMLALIHTWSPILPNWIKENVLEQLIIPKISETVNAWDPTSDPKPLVEWLLPWHVTLGDRIQVVMPPIRQKLSKALKTWTTDDRSGYGILAPWKDVWSQGTYTAFLAQNIVPKLGQTLETMELNPQVNPNYVEWGYVMMWLPLVHPDAIANIVTKYFFPRFYGKLCQWLDMPHRDFNEVAQWYKSWKARIPSQIVEYPTINENLRRALIAIDRSRKGQMVSNIAQQPIGANPVRPSNAPIQVMASPAQVFSVKDTIEIMAARNGLAYLPQQGRYNDGKQVYWFGTVSICIDARTVLVLDPIEFYWRNVGFDELMQMAGGGQ